MGYIIQIGYNKYHFLRLDDATVAFQALAKSSAVVTVYPKTEDGNTDYNKEPVYTLGPPSEISLRVCDEDYLDNDSVPF